MFREPPIREEIDQKPWYTKLLILWYLLSITIGSFGLYEFPLNQAALPNSANSDLTSSTSASTTAQFYTLSITSDIVLLWFFVLLVLPEWKFLAKISNETTQNSLWGIFIFASWTVGGIATFYAWDAFASGDQIS
jgi:hypothetical protein